MRKVLFSLVTILMVVVVTATFADENTLVRTMDNGLMVVVREHHAAPVVTMSVIVKTGPIYEDEYYGKGISHYLEHLVSGGPTDKRTEEETEIEIDMIGGQTNAYTSANHTYYYISTAAEYFGEALDIVSGYVTGVKINDFIFQREKKVVEKEIKMGEDEPGRVLLKLYNETAFVKSAVNVPNIGYRDLVKSVTFDDFNNIIDGPTEWSSFVCY